MTHENFDQNHDKNLIPIPQLIGLAGTLFGVWTYLESKGWSKQHSVTLVLLIFTGVLLLWLNFNYHRLRYRRYHIAETRRGDEGVEALGMLRRARKKITVMHSYPNIPSDRYTETLLKVVQENRVPLVRLMPDQVFDYPEVAEWLKRFNDLPGNLYRPHVIPEKMVLLPFHFILVDDREGILYFPDSGHSTDATEVVIFRDERFANLMRNLVIQLLDRRPPTRRRSRGTQQLTGPGG